MAERSAGAGGQPGRARPPGASCKLSTLVARKGRQAVGCGTGVCRTDVWSPRRWRARLGPRGREAPPDLVRPDRDRDEPSTAGPIVGRALEFQRVEQEPGELAVDRQGLLVARVAGLQSQAILIERQVGVSVAQPGNGARLLAGRGQEGALVEVDDPAGRGGLGRQAGSRRTPGPAAGPRRRRYRRTSSTRRFWARPSSVALGALGASMATPAGVSRAALIPRFLTSSSTTAWARRRDRPRL